MKTATFVFYGSLNDFLPRNLRGKPVTLSFQGSQSSKHLIESLHIPHPEVKTVHSNEIPVGLEYLVRDGDLLAVVPFGPQDFPWLASPCFLLDNHLGKLATFLRILGFDSAYRSDSQDADLARIASREDRILLTRDRGLLMRKLVTQGYCIRSLDPHKQLAEVMERYNLAGHIQPFSRCLRCNTVLEPVEKEIILNRLEPLTRQYYDEFHRCPACDQLYWKGSHYEHMSEFLISLTGAKQQ